MGGQSRLSHQYDDLKHDVTDGSTTVYQVDAVEFIGRKVVDGGSSKAEVLVTDDGYREVTYDVGQFPITVTLWTTSGKTTKKKETAITRDASKRPTQVVTTYYDSDGTTVRATITETVTYNVNSTVDSVTTAVT